MAAEAFILRTYPRTLLVSISCIELHKIFLEALENSSPITVYLLFSNDAFYVNGYMLTQATVSIT